MKLLTSGAGGSIKAELRRDLTRLYHDKLQTIILAALLLRGRTFGRRLTAANLDLPKPRKGC